MKDDELFGYPTTTLLGKVPYTCAQVAPERPLAFVLLCGNPEVL